MTIRLKDTHIMLIDGKEKLEMKKIRKYYDYVNDELFDVPFVVGTLLFVGLIGCILYYVAFSLI